jgi:DNA-directed RNA polymerase subunit H (RpoH/RPB5)
MLLKERKMIDMKMSLRMEGSVFDLEFDGAEEACEFINVFLRNNPKASLLTLSQKEKKQMLNNAAIAAAEILGVSANDKILQEAVKIAGEVIGINRYDN